MVALIASQKNESAADVLNQHLEFIDLMEKSGIRLLSLGVDGAPTELAAQKKLLTVTNNFLSYSNSDLNVHVKVPLIGENPRPIVIVQDPKHARKTACNQLLSGACLLAFGNCYANIEQLLDVQKDRQSPLND